MADGAVAHWRRIETTLSDNLYYIRTWNGFGAVTEQHGGWGRDVFDTGNLAPTECFNRAVVSFRVALAWPNMAAWHQCVQPRCTMLHQAIHCPA